MAIRSINLGKSFGDPPTEVLKDVSFTIDDGEFIAITGRSGSGKSTLLYLLSTLDPPSSGELEIEGANVGSMSSEVLHRFRNRNMGFIFQFHYLLPELSALENILMPAMKTRQHHTRKKFAVNLLQQVGLAEKHHRLPSQLSGGEQQRVAIARALIMEPKYIFADEPTGNLDTENGTIVMDILKDINTRLNTTVVMVTHDVDYAAMAKRQIVLVDGQMEPTA